MSTIRTAVTVHEIERGLRQLGVREGGVLMVHASMARLGYVLHGASAVLGALERVLGPSGTLVVPTFTGDRTDPSCWVDPALPASMWNEVRDTMPTFDERQSMPVGMGQLSLAVLMDPRRRRSNHPLCSFAAIGPRAEELTADHDLRDPLGLRSPVGRARDLDGQVLLLGADQRSNSAIMHAEVCAESPQVTSHKGTFLAEIQGRRQWVTPTRIAECTQGYGNLEDELISSGLVRVERIGDADCRLSEIRALSDAVEHSLRHQPERVRCGNAVCRCCADG